LTITVRFWGTRGSIAAPGSDTCRYGGNTSSVELQIGDHFVVCDAGTGLRALGLDWLQRSQPQTSVHLFLSHTHFDHIQGFPFFAPAFRKDVTIYLYDPTGRSDSIRNRVLGQLVSEYCPVSTRDLAAGVVAVPFHRSVALGPNLSVQAIEQHHPGGSWGYAFESDGRRVVYATDSELDAQLQNGKSVGLPAEDERSFLPPVIAFYQNADLVIADAQYTDAEYSACRGWGHPRFSTVVDLAIAARVRQLALFHHDPRHSDTDLDSIVQQSRDRAKRRGSAVEIFAAEEGSQVSLGPDA
jgi:phosphoribosyl 1,2-cyclic phosphodiesterase